MLTLQGLKALVQQRLTAAVDEVFGNLEKTFTEYEEEIRRQRRLLDILTQTQTQVQSQVLTQTQTQVLSAPGTRQASEQPSLCAVSVKTEEPSSALNLNAAQSQVQVQDQSQVRVQNPVHNPAQTQQPTHVQGQDHHPVQTQRPIQIQVHSPVQVQNPAHNLVQTQHAIQVQNPDPEQEQNRLFKEEETPQGNEMEVDCGLDLNRASLDLDYDRLMLLVENSEEPAEPHRDSAAAFTDQEDSSLSSAQSGPQNDLTLEDHPAPVSFLDTSQSSLHSFSLRNPHAWVQNFRIPWERVPISLSQAISRGQRASGADRRAMVRAVVDAMRQHCPKPNRAACVEIAKIIVSNYPLTFADRTDEGEQLGTGYFSLLNQIKTRVENLNRGCLTGRKRKPRMDTLPKNALRSPGTRRIKVDSYGCVNWQPKSLPPNETSVSLESKRQKMLKIFEASGAKAAETPHVAQLMSLTYVLQRQAINSSSCLDVAALAVQFPFLFTKTGVCDHFRTLTGVDVLQRVSEALPSKGRKIQGHFWRQAQNREAQRVLDQLEETEAEPRRTGIGAVVLLMKHFLEREEAIFVLAEPNSTKTSVQNSVSLPKAPRIIAVGDSLLSSCRWMVSLDGAVAFELEDSSSFSEALSVFFSCFYVFNLEYEEPACATLELIQRYFVRINPEEGTKCTAKTGVSRKTGETVTRKTETVNCRVASFLRQLAENELRN